MTDLRALENEYGLLHLLYHRNVNQFRGQEWWKYVDLVHRHVRRILLDSVDVEEVQSSPAATLSAVKWDKQGRLFKVVGSSTPSVGVLKHRVAKRARYMVTKVVPAAYRSFMNIIQLGQFVALGFTLVGLLARIRAILETMVETETELGEVIVDAEVAAVAPPSEAIAGIPSSTMPDVPATTPTTTSAFRPTPKSKQVKAKKKKKKSAKSAIDDIFG